MAPPKKDKAKKGRPISTIPQLVLDPVAFDGELRDIKVRDEQWSEFTLNDGATIRLKPAIIEIRKVRNQFTPNGDPIYVVKSTVVVDTKIPENLKRKE